MSITTTTHLNFRGQAEEALTFYASVFGGDVVSFSHAQGYGIPADDPEADLVAWGEVRTDAGFHVMAFDVPAARPFDRGVSPVFVSVRGQDPAEITRYWQGLTAGATVLSDLAPAGWSPLYGMLTDRFGTTWVMDVDVPHAG